MFSFLQNHPFAVEAFFKNSFVLTFAAPKEELQNFLPPCLTLDTLNDKLAFIAVAMVQTNKLRPKGLPEFLGNDFFLVGYRIFVRYISNSDKKLRGLYILKSETNKKSMEFLGNILTRYSYTTTDITHLKNGTVVNLKSIRSKFDITLETETQEFPLPQNSPFDNWKEARIFAGPLPFTFSYDSEKKNVLIVEGVRQNWQPTPMKVINYNISFLNSLNLNEVHLASAFAVQNIPYYWKKGKIEKWNR